mmetsp:Transcript_2112/g.2991  ORF Transcript_2112/g.2991 Transcript_2112/m.2991 type:complete len:158 (+) Transcript_2112:348-821(+)
MASHRLIQHVGKTYGLRVSEALYDRLNVYYFVDGHSLNDRPLLAKVAAEELAKLVSGSAMSESEVLDFLESDQGRENIENALSALRDMKIHGIPKFIIDGTYMVDGAAPQENFVPIFRKIEKGGKNLNGPVFADLLGISDDVIAKGSHTKESTLTMA